MKNGVKIIMKYFVLRATNDLERRCAKNKRTKLSKENKDKTRRKDRKKVKNYKFNNGDTPCWKKRNSK